MDFAPPALNQFLYTGKNRHKYRLLKCKANLLCYLCVKARNFISVSLRFVSRGNSAFMSQS